MQSKICWKIPFISLLFRKFDGGATDLHAYMSAQN